MRNRVIFAKMALGSVVLLGALSGCGGGDDPDAGASNREPPVPVDPAGSASNNPSSPAGGTDTPNTNPAVSSGVATQRRMEIALDKYALDWTNLGDIARITVGVTDTAGNPAPIGTTVYFQTSAGVVDTSCILGRSSGSSGASNQTSTFSECSVSFKPHVGANAQNGYAVIVAYLEGEEAYIDKNGNHQYDAGEPYYESGAVYRDDDWSGSYNATNNERAGDELIVGEPTGVGSAVCRQDAHVISPQYLPRSVPGTCDGKWGKTNINAQVRVPVSYASKVGLLQNEIISVDGRLELKPVEDYNSKYVPEADGQGNLIIYSYSLANSKGDKVSAPAETPLSVLNLPDDCSVTVSPDKVPTNSIEPAPHVLFMSGNGCSPGASFNVQIKSKTGNIGDIPVTIPFPQEPPAP